MEKGLAVTVIRNSKKYGWGLPPAAALAYATVRGGRLASSVQAGLRPAQCQGRDGNRSFKKWLL